MLAQIAETEDTSYCQDKKSKEKLKCTLVIEFFSRAK